jgi:polyhydroxyalkanoate synthesis regulator phasin
MADDYDDDRPTREEILERYGWQPGEREQVEREMVERQVRIDAERHKDAVVREAERQRPLVVTNDAQSKRDADAATKYWHGYIREQLDQQQRALLKAIAGAVIGEEKARQQDVAEARSHYRDICNRFDDHPTHDEIAALRKTIDELRERIAKLEAVGKAAPLRAVS